MTGTQMPFEQSSQLFEALTLVSLSDHSIAKATQAMGYEVQVQEAEWQEQSQNENWLQEQERSAAHPRRLYGAMDAAKVHIRGEKDAEKDPWKDLKVGAWFSTTPITFAFILGRSGAGSTKSSALSTLPS